MQIAHFASVALFAIWLLCEFTHSASWAFCESGYNQIKYIMQSRNNYELAVMRPRAKLLSSWNMYVPDLWYGRFVYMEYDTYTALHDTLKKNIHFHKPKLGRVYHNNIVSVPALNPLFS